MPTLRDDEQILKFLMKKRKKLRFWIHPILTRRQRQRQLHSLIQQLKLYHDFIRTTYLKMSVGQFGIILLFVYRGLVRILSYVHTGCQMRGLIGQITLF